MRWSKAETYLSKKDTTHPWSLADRRYFNGVMVIASFLVGWNISGHFYKGIYKG